MTCDNKPRCVPAISKAFSGTIATEIAIQKLCGIIDLFALLRDQFNADANLETPVLTTATTDIGDILVDELMKLGGLYFATVTANVATETQDPGIATRFGLLTEVNCNQLPALLKDLVNDEPEELLGSLTSAPVSPAVAADPSDTTNVNNVNQNLCCLSEHYKRIRGFIESYLVAKKCQSNC